MSTTSLAIQNSGVIPDILKDPFTLSHLWILVTYECVRTIDQIISKGTFDPVLKTKSKETKKLLNRIRIPLAKLEPEGANPSDFRYPHMVTDSKDEIGWEVGKNYSISVRDLSEKVFNLFTAIAKI